MRGPWRRFRWLTSGLYLTMLAAGPVGSGLAAPPPDLSGTWTLNEEQSQDARAAMRDAAGKTRQGEGGGGGHRGGRRGGGGGGGEGGGGGARGPRGGEGSAGGEGTEAGEHNGGGDFGRGAKELQIAASGAQLTITEVGEAAPRVLYTDGRKLSEEKAGVGTVKTQAQWEEGALKVVTKGPKGRTKTEIFEMTHDRKRLYVLVTLEGYGRGSGVTFKRVYDPEPPPTTPTPTLAPAQGTEPAPPGRGWDEDDYDGDEELG
jgi:hypothetical protein